MAWPALRAGTASAASDFADRAPARRAGRSRWRRRTARRAAQHLGHRRNRLAVEIDVEHGDVEIGLFGERQGFLDAAGLRRDGMAEIAQHAFQQHADHQFVLDDEDALAAGHTRCSCQARVIGSDVICAPCSPQRQPAPSVPSVGAVCRAQAPDPPSSAGGIPVYADHRYGGKKRHESLIAEGTVAAVPAADDVERMEFQLALRRRGISDQAVLRAMDEVPREYFVAPGFADSAYIDQALPIACGQTISQPFIVAYMTEKLEVEPQHRVLEVGTGSGYQAAILARLGARGGEHRAVSHARRCGARAAQNARLRERHGTLGRRHGRCAGLGAIRPHHGDGRRRGGAGSARRSARPRRQDGLAGRSAPRRAIPRQAYESSQTAH